MGNLSLLELVKYVLSLFGENPTKNAEIILIHRSIMATYQVTWTYDSIGHAIHNNVYKVTFFDYAANIVYLWLV